MRCPNFFIGLALLVGMASAAPIIAKGADLPGEYRGAQPPRAHVSTTIRAPCPDRYSCYPLYGNFRMPYATPAYWARYTMG